MIFGARAQAREGVVVGGKTAGHDGAVAVDGVGGTAVVVGPADGGAVVAIVVYSHSNTCAGGTGQCHGGKHRAGQVFGIGADICGCAGTVVDGEAGFIRIAALIPFERYRIVAANGNGLGVGIAVIQREGVDDTAVLVYGDVTAIPAVTVFIYTINGNLACGAAVVRGASNQVVYRHCSSGRTTINVANHIGRVIVVDIACKGVGAGVCVKLTAGGIAARVAAHSHKHVVDSVPHKTAVEGHLLPEGIGIAQVAGEDELEVMGILDEATAQGGGRGVHQINLAVVELIAAGSHIGGLKFHTLDLDQVAQTIGRDNHLGVAVVVVAVAGVIVGGDVGSTEVGVGHDGGGGAATHQRLCQSTDGQITNLRNIRSRTVNLHANHIVGVSLQTGEGVAVGGNTRGHSSAVDIHRVGGTGICGRPMQRNGVSLYIAGRHIKKRHARGQRHHLHIVEIVVAVGIGVGGNVMEGNISVGSSVVVKEQFVIFLSRSAVVDDGVDGHKGAGIHRVGHHAHNQTIGAAGLFHPESHHQAVHRGGKFRHGHIATIVQTQAVAAAVGIGAAVVHLGFLRGSHRHILGPDGPTWGHHAGGGGGAGGLLVEVHHIRHRHRGTCGGEGDHGSLAGVGTAEGTHSHVVLGGGHKSRQRNLVAADHGGSGQTGGGAIFHQIAGPVAVPNNGGGVVDDVGGSNVHRQPAGGCDGHLHIVDIVIAIAI